MKRILLLWPDDEEFTLLKDVERREVTLAFRNPPGDIRRVGAAIFFEKDVGTRIARVEPKHKSGELDYLFKFTETVGTPGWNQSDLRSLLSSGQGRPFDAAGGVLGVKAGERVLEYVDANSGVGPTMRLWLFDSDRKLDVDQVANLPELREGTLLALRCAGMDATETAPDEHWGSSELDDLFLPPAPGEGPIIGHDLGVFLGMARIGAARVGSAHFRDDLGRTLKIYNVNRTPVESQSGADLVYFNVERWSVVLVQYKRMILERDSWIYRRDGQFESKRLVSKRSREV